MRIGFTGDFHLGFAVGRRAGEDFRQAKQAFKKILAEDPDVIVLMGDLFDSSVPKPEALRDAARILGMARGKQGPDVIGVGRDTPDLSGLPVLAIHGNHERRIRGETNPVQLLEYMGLLTYLHNSGVKVADAGFFGVGAVPESLAPQIFRKLSVRPFGSPSFFLFHQNLRPYVPARDSLTMSDLPAGFDYYVDGHIHTPRREKNLLITGSTVITQLKSGEERKVAWIWEDGAFREIELKTRPFVILKVDAGSRPPSEVEDEIEKRVIEVVSRFEEEPLIKVLVEGKLAEGFRPGDLSYRHSGRGIVYVDKRLEGGLKKVELKAKSVDDIIMNSLRDILHSRGLDLDIGELYRAILDRDGEKIWRLMRVDQQG